MSYREHFRLLFPEMPEDVEYVAIDHIRGTISIYKSDTSFEVLIGQFILEQLAEKEVNCQLVKLEDGRILELRGRSHS